MAAALDLRVMHVDRLMVVGVVGDAEDADAPRLAETMRRAVEEDDSAVVVLDCSLLEHLGDAAAAVLVATNEDLDRRHRRLVVRQPSPETRAVLEAAEGTHPVEIVDD
jgi:anti-anti-sigma factor